MARFALICLLALAGCQTDQDRLSGAAISAALIHADDPLPDLPAACTAEMPRAIPKASEPWVITQKRWEYLAENRDHLSNDCKTWWDSYRMERAGEGF